MCLSTIEKGQKFGQLTVIKQVFNEKVKFKKKIGIILFDVLVGQNIW